MVKVLASSETNAVTGIEKGVWAAHDARVGHGCRASATQTLSLCNNLLQTRSLPLWALHERSANVDHPITAE